MSLTAALGPHPYVGASIGFTTLPMVGDGLRVIVVSFLFFHVRIAFKEDHHV